MANVGSVNSTQFINEKSPTNKNHISNKVVTEIKKEIPVCKDKNTVCSLKNGSAEKSINLSLDPQSKINATADVKTDTAKKEMSPLKENLIKLKIVSNNMQGTHLSSGSSLGIIAVGTAIGAALGIATIVMIEKARSANTLIDCFQTVTKDVSWAAPFFGTLGGVGGFATSIPVLESLDHKVYRNLK